MDLTSTPGSLVSLARFVAICAPALYTGFTASDSLTFVEPLLAHAPDERTLAKQWLHGYQYGPYWVPPLIGSATLSNLHLAITAREVMSRTLYLVAAAGIFCILPITFLYMEPGINGACKWKVCLLLKDEGYRMSETSWLRPSSVRHGSTQASRRWAESSSMPALVRFWQKVNNLRWVLGAGAAIASGYATFGVG